MKNYCSRCGSIFCLGNCNNLDIFSEVLTLWSFDSDQGRIIFDMKRNNSTLSKITFVKVLLPQILDLVRDCVCRNHAVRLVVAPISSSSWARHPMQNCNHPNHIAAQSFSKMLQSEEEPMRESLEQLLYGFKSSRSLSIQRSQKKASRQNSQAEWSSEFQPRFAYTAVDFVNPRQINKESLCRKGRNKIKETIVVFDDVLSTGYTAARTALYVDPQAESNWVLVAALRTLKAQKGKS